MSNNILPRNVTPLALETLSDTPITVISGARQVGKSTLMRELLSKFDARVFNLDDLSVRAAAEADPDEFANQFPQGLLAIDEIQRVPQLLTSLKASVDRDRRPGRFLVTGSADLLSLRGSQDSLAGRAETIRLEGFSQDEVAGRSADFASFVWSLPDGRETSDYEGFSRRKYLEIITTPGFPEARARSGRARERWLANYVERLLAKDSTDITGIQYPDRLRQLLSVVAARNSGEFVASRIGREIDVPARSIPAYLDALRSVFLVRSIAGWSNNVAYRAVATPKVMIADTGLAAFLADVDAEGLEKPVSATIAGGLVEGFVVAELERQRAWSAKPTRMYHYRDHHNREVDIILEDRRRDVVGIEVKSTSNPRQDDFKGLHYLRERLSDRFIAGVVVHTGERALSFGDRLWALPIATLWNV
ncbi:ATP-binding protein [Gulosibacter molinativorax]|uniref:ATP-binding protein n=1 Tax=Gulosibacter molinativorax TaxID=256821 RepID=A0ABT7C9P6_9MICO|nr:ATP-binding protein [Gulosibacter molinativorax]MDJ1371869.1 ATP-binding protein [Gulosibacter molinativorax]QUY62518.1 AAA family ATPase [Gulosibacter molinativorax]